MTIPPEYLDLTLRDLLALYTGPGALDVPPELVEALRCAELVEELSAREAAARRARVEAELEGTRRARASPSGRGGQRP